MVAEACRIHQNQNQRRESRRFRREVSSRSLAPRTDSSNLLRSTSTLPRLRNSTAGRASSPPQQRLPHVLG
eukprot:3176241-Pleurochrysis_carterae.AAC.1